MHALSRRQQEVLQATVRHYVDTVEPVGSHTLVRRFGFPASPATVRSAMGALEQRGLLTQPHTSAGRIPSQLGYRLYVDELLPAPGAAAIQLERELAGLSLQWAALDDLLVYVARRLSDLTGLLSLITRPRSRAPKLQEIRLMPSGESLLVILVQGSGLSTSLHLRLPPGFQTELPILERWTNRQLQAPGDGAICWELLPAELASSGRLLRQALDSHTRLTGDGAGTVVAAGLGGLLAQPEFTRTSSLLPLVQLVETHPDHVLGPQAASDLESLVWIGSEHPHKALGQCAVVQCPYRTGDGGRGMVALVGPTRMAYATARAGVRSVAHLLQRRLS
ncbi:MAG: HrcA family transcriptional regulator [Cyanobacteriota bacterium]|nr:HrcA family transcriptional regulator [Cyanobacteriota bacterium]